MEAASAAPANPLMICRLNKSFWNGSVVPAQRESSSTMSTCESRLWASDVRLGGLVVQIDELLHHRIGQTLVAAPLGHALRREGIGPERTEGADELLLPVGQREVHLMAPFSLL